MNLVQITPGAGGMYCGNCFRDNALVAALRRLGHETLMVPLYLPMTLDEPSAAGATPTFFGGINVYLSQQLSWHRRAPAWFRRWFDAPGLLRWAAGKAAKTRAEDVGELSVSMLRGEDGNQVRELEELLNWLNSFPRPDAVFLSNALLVGLANRIREQLGARVVCFLQSEETFLDAIPEPHRSQSWQVVADRGRAIDGWIAPTRYFADRMSERLGLDSNRVHVVHNGISLEGYTQLARPQNLQGPVLGFFSRMCREKGLDLVVDAFLRLVQRGHCPNLRLKVGGGCGPGDRGFVEDLQRRLQTAGVSERVSFHPNLSRAEKLAFLASCDVISVPSRISEAFGLPIIESLAAGTPVVQPNVCGFAELIQMTRGGLVYGENTAEYLANALVEALSDPTRLAAWGAEGRRTVFERFTDEVMARNVIRTTENIIRSPTPASSMMSLSS